MKNKNKFVDVDNAREDEQVKVMENIIKNDECPFCLDNLKKYHKQPILKETKYWLLTNNQWPYPNTKVHLLIIYKKHAVNLSELADQSGEELLQLVKWAEKEYQIPGGGWAMRFGDTRYSSGTVNHIHSQFLVPDIKKEAYQPIRFKIGKSPDKLL
ncbi:MAG: hypothetical protein GW941_02380 [Candidatus Pacebacteria bacterium]|nr:hypothetical protein [Candidatus Paceibacterota bacterium]